MMLTKTSVSIDVDSSKILSHPSRLLTGACIEDVNHELYGGIDSQMVFGERFAEPAKPHPIAGVTTYGGNWLLDQGIVSVSRQQGAKLVIGKAPISDGRVVVDIFLPKGQNGNAGLIINLNKPGIGADAFDGYEVSLDAGLQQVVLGRHRQNWEPIANYPCKIEEGQWQQLGVKFKGAELEISVNGRKVASYTDHEHPLKAGRVALRNWVRDAKFRNLSITENGQKRDVVFEYDPTWKAYEVSRMWDPVIRGKTVGRFSLDTVDRQHSPQSQSIVFESGTGEFGLSNEGLNHWGMGLRSGKVYEGILWVKCPEPTTLWLSLESKDGKKQYAVTSVKAKGGDWNKVTYQLTPKETDAHGKLVVSLREPGSVKLGYVLLQPGAWGRFKGQPVRNDVAKGLIEQGLTVLRMGGCMVNHPNYLWKKMRGPRDQRAAHVGFWYPYSSYGWGPIEFLNFCESAGIVGVPDMHMGETPQDMADFVEYVNGPVSSKWGALRARDGHAAPFHLKYLQLGNEEAVNEAYWSKFKPMAEAIWAKDPDIQLVVGDYVYGDIIEDPYQFGGAAVTTLAIQKKIVDFANENGKSVWFDLHIVNDDPDQLDHKQGALLGLKSFIHALRKICPGKEFRVAVFEENAGNHTLRRGLGHAHAINEITRIADDVKVLCAANCLQSDKQNDNDWDQGLLFLSPMNVWGQPSYYVTQMASRNYLPVCVDATMTGPQDVLDVTATRSEDGKILQLQIVNMKDQPVDGKIGFGKWLPKGAQYKVEWIAGKLEDQNTEEDPKHIVSKKTKKALKLNDGVMTHTFPGYSFTILRFEN